jgi:excisionase family DNA binding protein
MCSSGKMVNRWIHIADQNIEHWRQCMSEYLTIKEVAERLRVSLQSVGRAIQRGDLAAHRIGGQYRIAVEAVEAMLSKTLTLKGNENE